MEVVDRENVKVPNSVIVSGLTDTDKDQDVTDYLNKYGHITRTLRVDDPESPYHRNAIVEYESGNALKALELKLPYDYVSPSDVTYQISALASKYVPTVADGATQSYFTELQKIAKLSGMSFEEVLELQLIRSPRLAQSPVTQPQVASPVKPTEIKENEAPITTVSFANPPEVQRVIVEHVVRSNAPNIIDACFIQTQTILWQNPLPKSRNRF